jgi:hypothetical protein
MQYEFLDRPNLWPMDARAYVFLGRAFDQIGQAQFGAKWTDAGPDQPSDESDQAELTWAKLCDEAERAQEFMRNSVRNFLWEHARSGSLLTALRRKAGGSLTNQSDSFWNYERAIERFERCETSRLDPSGCGAQYIFVCETSLTNLLSVIDGGPQRSPPAKIAAVRTAISEIWPRGVPQGLSLKSQFAQINVYLRKMGGQEVSYSTFDRAVNFQLAKLKSSDKF